MAIESVEVVNFATPATSGTVASEVGPSKKVTVPVALSLGTIAVKITSCPTTEGLSEENMPIAGSGSKNLTTKTAVWGPLVRGAHADAGGRAICVACAHAQAH